MALIQPYGQEYPYGKLSTTCVLPVATAVRLRVSPKGCGYAELVGMVTRTRHSNRNLDTPRRQADAGDNTHTLNEILPQRNRQKVNSDEREVVQTTYPQRVAGRLIPTKENMRHYASLENTLEEIHP